MRRFRMSDNVQVPQGKPFIVIPEDMSGRTGTPLDLVDNSARGTPANAAMG
jgi:hypothetical protein